MSTKDIINIRPSPGTPPVTPPGNTPEATLFEYRVMSQSTYGIEQALNALGREGWELIAVDPATFSPNGNRNGNYIFKRALGTYIPDPPHPSHPQHPDHPLLKEEQE